MTVHQPGLIHGETKNDMTLLSELPILSYDKPIDSLSFEEKGKIA